AAQLKQQVHRAEKATQELDEQWTRAVHAEYSLATLQVQMQECEAKLEEQRARTARAENSLAPLQTRTQEYEAHRGIRWMDRGRRRRRTHGNPLGYRHSDRRRRTRRN